MVTALRIADDAITLGGTLTATTPIVTRAMALCHMPHQNLQCSSTNFRNSRHHHHRCRLLSSFNNFASHHLLLRPLSFIQIRSPRLTKSTMSLALRPRLCRPSPPFKSTPAPNSLPLSQIKLAVQRKVGSDYPSHSLQRSHTGLDASADNFVVSYGTQAVRMSSSHRPLLRV